MAFGASFVPPRTQISHGIDYTIPHGICFSHYRADRPAFTWVWTGVWLVALALACLHIVYVLDPLNH